MTSNTELGIADLVRHHRRAAGLTQKQLGELAGVNQITIGRIEANITDPKVDTVKRITKALGIRIEDLVKE